MTKRSCVDTSHYSCDNYPVHVCAAGLCVSKLVTSVCVCMYVCMYVCGYVDKNRLFRVLPLKKSPVSVIYCSLIEFNGQKRGSLCQGFVLEKKFETILLYDGRRVRITVSHGHALSTGTCNAAMHELTRVCNANECRTPTYNCSCADLQYRYRYSLY